MKDRTRFGNGPPGGTNYFCEAYRQFFDYALLTLMDMAKAIKQGRLTRHTRRVEDVRIQVPHDR